MAEASYGCELWATCLQKKTHATAAPSNLDAAITMRSPETELQNTKELRATTSEITAPKPDLNAKDKKNDL